MGKSKFPMPTIQRALLSVTDKSGGTDQLLNVEKLHFSDIDVSFEISGAAGPVDCVIVGIDSSFSYHKLRGAPRRILEAQSAGADHRQPERRRPELAGAGALRRLMNR